MISDRLINFYVGGFPYIILNHKGTFGRKKIILGYVKVRRALQE